MDDIGFTLDKSLIPRKWLDVFEKNLRENYPDIDPKTVTFNSISGLRHPSAVLETNITTGQFKITDITCLGVDKGMASGMPFQYTTTYSRNTISSVSLSNNISGALCEALSISSHLGLSAKVKKLGLSYGRAHSKTTTRTLSIGDTLHRSHTSTDHVSDQLTVQLLAGETAYLVGVDIPLVFSATKITYKFYIDDVSITYPTGVGTIDWVKLLPNDGYLEIEVPAVCEQTETSLLLIKDSDPSKISEKVSELLKKQSYEYS